MDEYDDEEPVETVEEEPSYEDTLALYHAQIAASVSLESVGVDEQKLVEFCMAPSGEVIEASRFTMRCTSGLVRHRLETCGDRPITLPASISSDTMHKVIEWCDKHRYDKWPYELQSEDEVSFDVFQDNFLDVDDNTLIAYLEAADYLEIPTLVNAVCRKCAGMMQVMSAVEIREAFSIKADLTAREEAAIRREDAWLVERRHLDHRRFLPEN